MRKLNRIVTATVIGTQLLAATVVFAAQAPPNSAPRLWVKGNYVHSDVAPEIKNERMLVPVRVIAENLGYKVDWNQVDKKATVTKDNTKLELQLGKNTMDKTLEGNAQVIHLDAPLSTTKDRAMLPLRAVAESFGEKVDWDKVNRVAIIGDGYKPEPVKEDKKVETVKQEQKTGNYMFDPNFVNKPVDPKMSDEEIIKRMVFVTDVKNVPDVYKNYDVVFPNALAKEQVLEMSKTTEDGKMDLEILCKAVRKQGVDNVFIYAYEEGNKSKKNDKYTESFSYLIFMRNGKSLKNQYPLLEKKYNKNYYQGTIKLTEKDKVGKLGEVFKDCPELLELYGTEDYVYKINERIPLTMEYSEGCRYFEKPFGYKVEINGDKNYSTLDIWSLVMNDNTFLRDSNEADGYKMEGKTVKKSLMITYDKNNKEVYLIYEPNFLVE